MAILQALLTLLGRSLGKILNAMFGWAVVALFGQTTRRQQTVLSALVALAAAWPLLVLGIAFPRVATAILAFVPPSAQGPRWVVRLVWLGLTLAVPVALGLTVAARRPPGGPGEPFARRALRGFPVTLALAAAFLLTFVAVPAVRLATAARRRVDEHVPLVTTAERYDEVVVHVSHALARHRIAAVPSPPPWWLTGPTRILSALGGRAFRGFLPDRLAYWRGPDLEIALYPSDLLLRGARGQTAFAHGLLAEALARTQAFQTFDPAAQALEKRIARVWQILDDNPLAHRRSAAMARRLDELTAALTALDVPYEEWSVLYRKCAQLSRAMEGKGQLLAKGDDMTTPIAPRPDPAAEPAAAPPARPADDAAARAPAPTLSSVRLLSETTREAVALVRSEIELAKVELKEDLRHELSAAKGLGVAAVCGLLALDLLLLAGVFALALYMPAWGAALAVAALVGAVAGATGVYGWKHLRTPLVRTRRTVEEDIRWAKERIS